MSAVAALLRPLRAPPSTTLVLETADGDVFARALADDVMACAWNLLERGVRPGQRVAVFADNHRHVVTVLLAHHLLGVVHVPINPGYQAAELQHIVDDAGVSLLLCDEAHEALAAQVAGRRACRLDALVSPQRRAVAAPKLPPLPADDDVALLIYTSGTTGKSKGCALTFENVSGAVSSLMAAWGVTDRDVVVHALPLFHVHGLCVALHGALVTGARVRLLPRFDPALVVDAVRQGGTVFMGVPTMVARLNDHLDKHPDDGAVLGRARLFCSGSAPLSPLELERFRTATGHVLLERYGMSETLITLSNPLHGERKAGTVGRPLPGVSIRVVDDDGADVAAGVLGELWVKGPGVMRGYWNNDDATSAAFCDGWFKTGDVVRVDDGVVTIVGRASTDILKVGGYKLSTREIEDALAAHPAVAEVAVVGVPDREWGERVVACVVARPGASVTLAALQDATALHASKKPRGLLLLDALPKNAMGKVQKKLLAERAALECP